MTEEPTVFIVDDDPAITDSLSELALSVDLKSRSFGSAGEFLNSYDDDPPGCLILDVRMAEMSGLELQRALTDKDSDLPIIIVTGHGDVQVAVHAMKAGAFDFIEKPFSNQMLLERVQDALKTNRVRRTKRHARKEAELKLDKLTPRERDIFDRLVLGKTNKAIANELELSEKTIEGYRANVTEKLGIGSLENLISLSTAIEA